MLIAVYASDTNFLCVEYIYIYTHMNSDPLQIPFYLSVSITHYVKICILLRFFSHFMTVLTFTKVIMWRF